VSRLRARCPDCRTLTAVALGPEYQCHSCGREFAAGLVRVPRAWGVGGEAMAAAAFLELPYPETTVIEAETLGEQSLLLAAELPVHPLVLGGCCCSHVGAVEGLSATDDTLALVWIDAHGDLNTPQTSPSGNAWGMPLRMLLDGGAVEPANVVLIGARNLDPPELEFIESSALHRGEDALGRALEGTDAVYIALDGDAVEPGELAVFMPEPDGLGLEEIEMLLRDVTARSPLAGLGFSGVLPDATNAPKLARLAAAAGL
jgi:arginase